MIRREGTGDNMSVEEDRAARRQGFLDWDVEKRLPAVIGDFHFRRMDQQDGRLYYAFEYVSESTGWAVRSLFDEETMDYMIKTDFRLFVMTDIELITGDFEKYKTAVEKLLKKNMTRELLHRDSVSVVVKDHAFTRWDFSEALPPHIGRYERLIDPSRPLMGLNGSYIIGLYEWKEGQRGIIFYYNMFRNEYYAEMNAEKIPVIIHEFDADTIEQLEKKIKKHLAKELDQLTKLVPES